MKRIYNYEQYLKQRLNEAEDTKLGETTPNRSSGLLVNLFATELAENIKYWFSYGVFSKGLDNGTNLYALKDINEISSGVEKVEFWIDEFLPTQSKPGNKGKSELNSDEPIYSWRIKYIPIDPKERTEDSEPEKSVTRVKLIIDIFGFDSQNRLKNYEVEQDLDSLDDKKLLDKMNWLKDKIISAPKNNKDSKKFSRRQERNLRDNAY